MELNKTMNKINRFVFYRLSRLYVKRKQRKRRKSDEKSYKLLASEELSLVKKIELLAKENRSGIRYDMETGETLIIASDYLVILVKGKIEVYNHTGFIQMVIPEIPFNKLRSMVDKEAHIERRKLKHQTKENIKLFIERIG